eukprot:scaffold30909_cov63-Phaeocystis_antarctica.AAC.6
MSEALGSRPVPGTPSGKRPAGTHRAVRVVCMPPEENARAAQLAPSAVTDCSRTICHQKCGWPGLSDEERLVEEHARSRGVELNMMASSTETCSVGCIYSWWLRRHVVVAALHSSSGRVVC